MINRHRHVPVDADERANQIAGKNAANIAAWVKRLQEKRPPDLRNENDLRRHRRVLYDLSIARRFVHSVRHRRLEQRQ